MLFVKGKSVSVLVRSLNIRKESYLETLIDVFPEALKKSKHCLILRLATKEEQLLSRLTNLRCRMSIV